MHTPLQTSREEMAWGRVTDFLNFQWDDVEGLHVGKSEKCTGSFVKD
jgi:hypothetical protein